MIEVGDLVRIKNETLRADSLTGFSRTNWKKRNGRIRFRGKQVISKVVAIVADEYDWRSRRRNRIVELDTPNHHDPRWKNQISTDWLVVHRKAKVNCV